jgi:hypothetical protein
MAGKRAGLRAFRETVGYDVNPYCLKHRKRMQVQIHLTRGGSLNFICLACYAEGAPARKRRKTRKRNIRPYCVKCRVMMHTGPKFYKGGHANKQFKCPTCGVTTLDVIVARFGYRPNCVRCRIEMHAINWKPAKKSGGGWTHVDGWKCRRCRRSCRASSMDKVDEHARARTCRMRARGGHNS